MSPRTAGRILGAMFLLQSALTPVVYFRLLPPGSRATFLETAAPNAPQVRVAILLSYVVGAMTLAAAIVAWPVIRRHGERLALALVAVAVVGCGTLAMENLVLRQMLVLSVHHASAGHPEALAMLAPAVREHWRQAHFTNLLMGNVFLLLLHLTLFRFGLVPRIISGAGLAAVVLGLGNVAAPLLGGAFRFPLMAPLGVVQLALVAWLLARGLAEKPAAAPPRMASP